MRIRISATPENRNLFRRATPSACGRQAAGAFGSPWDLSSEKIDPCLNRRMQKSDFFSVEKSTAAKRGTTPFVSVKDCPHHFAEDAINFDFYQSGLFEHPRISILTEQKAFQHTASMKSKISLHKESCFARVRRRREP
jgi:hypothetical protein